LETVVIKAEKRKFEKLGSATYSKAEMAYWRNIEGLGGELATQIDIGKTNTLLHDLKFNILENLSDSLLVRVKIYDYYRNAPGKNLANTEIFHVIRKKKGVDTIPLRDYNIMVHDDIVVSLELVEVYGDAIFLALSTTPYGGTAFKRAVSQDKWTSYPGIGLGFNLMSSYSEAPSNWAAQLREKPKKISLYWDASLGMKGQHKSEEFTLLSNYINVIRKVHPEIEVQVVTFSDRIWTKQNFVVKRGRMKKVIDYLKGIEYHGTTNYSDVLKTNEFNAQAALVFTDGTALESAIESEVGIPVYIINSNRMANHKLLDDVSFISGGQYIDLSRLSTKRAVEYMLEFVNDGVEYKSMSVRNNDKGKVYGVVYDEQGPIQGALVRIKNTYTETRTESNGRYKISADPGDILQIKALGMKPKDTMVGELKKLHIPLKPEGELLDAVTVRGNISEDEIVKTPFGEKKKASVGYSIGNSITSEEIEDYQVDLEQVLMKMPGIIVVPNPDDGGATKRYVIRKMLMTAFTNGGLVYPAVIVDGMAYDQNLNKLPFINAQDIKKITVLSTAASTMRYGQIAAYGAIVIEMKDGLPESTAVNRPRFELAQGNEYSENVINIDDARRLTRKKYILDYERAATPDQAKQVYFEYLSDKRNISVDFFIESGNYFMDFDAAFAESILSNIVEIAPNNVKALKGLAYVYESFNLDHKARSLYEKLVNLKPGDVQSYLDLARNYKQIGKYEEASILYRQMVGNSIPNVDFNEVGPLVFNEFKQLTTLHKSQIDYSEIPEELMQVGYKKDIRLLFEWNDPLADFEIQFVSPEKRFFIFSHNIYGDQERMKKEIENGFYSKEFDLDEAEKGEWLINIKYTGDTDEQVPTMIKYTLYKNYGLTTEERIVKTIPLQDFDSKITLDSFSY
jgi:tetratricopeptide (TPR) repeat protein